MTEWVQAIVWGLIQGFTEFLPISSSGHLVVIPEFLSLDAPDLATSALLHIGTLAAVVAYYRKDLRWLLGFGRDPIARRVLGLLVVASLPSALALLVEGQVESLQSSTTAVGVALIVTGVIVWTADRFLDRAGDLEGFGVSKALLVGFAQFIAVIPGISRSGSTITAGMGLGLSKAQAARFSFLLGIPAIAAAGALQGKELLDGGGIPTSAWLAVGVAAVSGYAAIALLLRVLERVGLRVFAPYCLLVGVAALVFL